VTTHTPEIFSRQLRRGTNERKTVTTYETELQAWLAKHNISTQTNFVRPNVFRAKCPKCQHELQPQKSGRLICTNKECGKAEPEKAKAHQGEVL
jgi:hypothetical protein